MAALQVLAERAPTHLRWLQRQYVVIFVAALRGGWIQLIPDVGILRLNPHTVSRATEKALALELVAAAALARLHQAGLRDSTDLRAGRRASLDGLWFARRLGLGDAYARPWRERLAQYPTRHAPHQKGTSSTDA